MVSHYFLTAVLWFEPAQAYVVTKLLNTPTTRLQTHAGHVRQHLHSDGRRVLSILPHAISRELKLDWGSIAWCTAQERWRSGMTLQGIAWEPLQLLRRRA